MKKNILLWLIGSCVCVILVVSILLFMFRCDVFGHQYDEVKTPPTCIEDGFTTYSCTICGHSEDSDYVEKMGHEYFKKHVYASCTEQGYTNYNCVRCGDHYVDDYTPVREHRYKTTSTTATCSEAGINSCVCEDCGYSTTQEQAALGHNFVTKTDIAATCTGIGIKKSECTRCGERTEETTPKLGHDWRGEYCINCENINPEYICKRLIHENGKTIDKVYLYAGDLSIKCTYKGTGNFYIRILDDNQDFVKLVCNEIGSYVVDTTIKLSEGWYYIEIYGSSGTWNWTMGGYYWESSLARNAIRDYRNAHPDEICSCYDLMEYFWELGIPEDAINAVDIFTNVPEGYFNGAAFESDEARTQYFIQQGFSREAIIKWYVDFGYSTEKATEHVDGCLIK